MTDQSATMLLYREIGRGQGIDGAAFAEEMYWLSKNVPLINVRINSPGGSIFEGYSIYSAMREVNVPVDTYNDFVAASMGGIIHQQGRKRYAADNSMIMLHNPSGGGDTLKDKEVLGILKNSLVDAYVARTGKDGQVISDLMDVETWVEARKVNGVSAMVEMGLADKLFNSSVKINNDAQIFNAAKLYSISNNFLKQDDMENQKLEELTKQVSDLSKVVDSLSKEKDEKDKEIEALKKSIEDKDKVLKEASDKAAVELIENAVTSGKVKKELKDSMIEKAKSSYDVVKTMLDAMPESKAVRFTNFAGSGEKKEEGRENWTYKDWETKDNKGLEKMFKEDKEQYNTLLNNWKKSK